MVHVFSSGLKTAVVTLSVCLTILGSFQANADSQTQADIEEITVTGKRPGPPLWSVRSGDNVLWVFATQSPLPKHLEWDDQSVKRIMKDSGVLLTPPGFSASVSNPLRIFGLIRQFNKLKKLPNDQVIEDVLSPELLQLYTQVTDKYGIKRRKLESYRPLFLAEEVSKRAFKAAGLRADDKIKKRIKKLAKQNDVETIGAVGALSVDEALELLSEISLEHELKCLEVTLGSLDKDVSKAKQHALAWSEGISAQQLTFPNVARVCSDVLAQTPSAEDIYAQTQARWLANGVQALKDHAVSFAYLPFSQVVSENGLLQQLRLKVAAD